MLSPLMSGIFIGLALGFGLFLIRRTCWNFIRPALLVGAIIALLIALASIIFGTTLLGKSSESVTSGMLLIVVVGAACVVSLFLSLFVSLAQAKRIGDTLGRVWTTTLIEPILVAWIVWGYQVTVVYPFQQSLSASAHKKETEQRAKVERLKSEIPAQFRKVPMSAIVERNRIREDLGRRGLPMLPPLVPPEVEKLMAEYERERNLPPPRIDFARYTQAYDEGRSFGFGAFGGWLLGAILIPLAFKPKLESIGSRPSGGDDLPRIEAER